MEMKESFLFRGHICLVFEGLEMSMRGYIRKMNIMDIPLITNRNICRQILKGL